MSRRNTLLVSIGFILQSGFLLFASVSFAQIYEITQLTHNSIDEFSPYMNDAGQVVWYQWEESDHEVFLNDGTSVIQITENAYDDRNPLINDRGEVTWRGYDGSDWEIFLYDGASITQLTDNSYDEAVAGINDRGDIVWVGSDGSDDEIFLYDGTGTTQLSDNTYDDMFPKLNNSGQVAWQGSLSQYTKYVFLYDGNATIQLPDSLNGVFPHLNNQGKVVFGKSAGGGPIVECFDFFLYDGTSTSKISSTCYYGSGEAEISDTGLVAWSGSLYPYESPSWDPDIFLYDGTQTRQLEGFEETRNPHVNDVGQFVWAGFDLLGLDDEIFCYDGAHVTQLTFNSYDDFGPQINNRGEILWSRTMGDGTLEIFLAKPQGSLCSGTTVASTLGADRAYGPSDLGRHFVYLLLPVVAVIAFRLWRGKP